ncbi:uncharacterized protein EI90DRAFT_159369 [Cantharellus anzutake]|uniref:uncharacterized protein n=1 Tax=Cantharellus anzutake TaxID=1750568 RepID=UPI0019073D50|nr:uncharacterized protein EI90DRAFT_159369 [Cantharellus anzutake]KAF8336323.1 hypothetical protein EI90DRAFT_159369 [Cantharellus anzutake]
MLPDPSSYVCLATQTVLSLDFHILARICIVDYCGTILFDSLVRPTEEVTDWLPERTGFDPSYFTSDGPMGVIDFEIARQEAVRHVNGKTIVGYKLWQSLDVLRLSHPADLTRDVATYFAFQTAFRSQSDDDGLQKLLREFMHRTIQHGYENAVRRLYYPLSPRF